MLRIGILGYGNLGRGVECAVTRTSMDGTGPYLPKEAFTVREALDSNTIRGAFFGLTIG